MIVDFLRVQADIMKTVKISALMLLVLKRNSHCYNNNVNISFEIKIIYMFNVNRSFTSNIKNFKQTKFIHFTFQLQFICNVCKLASIM